MPFVKKAKFIRFGWERKISSVPGFGSIIFLKTYDIHNCDVSIIDGKMSILAETVSCIYNTVDQINVGELENSKTLIIHK
jgi:hypothetical protein